MDGSGRESGFLRLPQVLERIPVSRSAWWLGVREGRYPRPVKLSVRTSAWPEKEISDLCERLTAQSRGTE